MCQKLATSPKNFDYIPRMTREQHWPSTGAHKVAHMGPFVKPGFFIGYLNRIGSSQCSQAWCAIEKASISCIYLLCYRQTFSWQRICTETIWQSLLIGVVTLLLKACSTWLVELSSSMEQACTIS